MIVEIRNVDKKFIPIFEEFAESIQAQCSIFDEKSSMEKAIEEIKSGDCEVFEDF